MPPFAESEKQKERKALVHQHVALEKSVEAYYQRMEPQDQLIDEAQTQQDAISLGKKKTFKPNDVQKRRNARIEQAQKETGIKKATADTLDMHRTMEEVSEVQGKSAPIELAQTVLSLQFSPKMLISSNIRAHFAEYMQAVNAYQTLKDHQYWGQKLAPVKDNMELLTQRMRAYCSQNRLHMDGSYMSDKEEAESFQLDRKKLLKGELFGKVRKEEYDPTKHSSADASLAGTMADATIMIPGNYSMGHLRETRIAQFYAQRYEASSSYIWQLRSDVDAIEEEIRSLQEQNKTEHDSQISERLVYLRKERLEMTAFLNLAEAESRVKLSKDLPEEERTRLIQEAKEAHEDVNYIMQRYAKERLPYTSAGNTPGLMDRSKALSSKSDKQNFAFKQSILEEAERLNGPGLEEVKQCAIAYATATHYTVGNDEESALLMKLQDAIKAQELLNNGAALAALSAKLAQLSRTSLPDLWDVPDELKVECCGKTPEEKGSIHDKGHFRNWLMTSKAAMVWEDRKDEPLFAHEPTINDLRQGKISNCYMLAAVTKLIAHDPQAIKNVIKDNGDGTATVRLYKGEIPMFIHLDKKTAHLRTGGAIASEGPLWMQLIELAAAHVGMFKKERSGFGSLWYGQGENFFAMLTGIQATGKLKTTEEDGSDSYNGDAANEDELFERIRDADANGELIHMGTKDSTGAGMNSGHAYTVLGARVVDGKKYVTLRNPYANMSYRKDEYGDVEKSSTYFSSVADETCGQFDMPFEEFVRNAKTVAYTKLSGPLFPGGTTKEELEAYASERMESFRRLEAAILEIDSLEEEEKKTTVQDQTQTIDTEQFGTIPLMPMKQEDKKEGE